MAARVCKYAPNCYRRNEFHWKEFQHPNQDKPLPSPDVSTWLDQYSCNQKGGSPSPEKLLDRSVSHGAATRSRTPFTPMKSGPEVVPETPSSEAKRAESESYCTHTTAADCQIRHECEPAALRDGPSKRRARIIESSDEESENVKLFCAKEDVAAPPRKKKRTFSAESSDDEPEVVDVESSIHHSVDRSAVEEDVAAPPRKKKRTFSAESSDDEPEVVDVESSIHHSASSSVDRSAVDLTSSASPQEIVLGTEHPETRQTDGEDEQDHGIEESVNELLSKCEEVGEGLRKQVELAVIEQPKCVGSDKLRLKKYQLVGLTWLNNLHMRGVNGILADEMGLGKTIQSIAFLGHLQSSGESGPHLVVSPASTLENWKRELNLWLPSANVAVYHGTQKERDTLRRKIAHGDVDVILTTYSYFQTDSAKQDRAFLRRFEYGCMVLDEGQAIKNSDASRNRRLMQLTYNRCILLTGTPINNNLPELLALLRFILPDFFEGDGMQELHELCIRAEKSGPSQDKDRAAAGLVERIRALMDPFVLRRRKADVLGELVAKVDNVQMIEVGAAQRRIYDGILERWRRERAATSDRKGREREGRTITSLFTELRKAANHPLLVRSRVSDKDLAELATELHRREHFGDRCTREMVLKELQGYNDYEISHACQGYRALSRFVLPAAAVATSAKFDALGGLLTDAAAGGHRVLIFSQWTSMLDLLEDFLGGRDVSFLRLDGSTPVKERQELIDEFNRDESVLVFLLSTRAGGLGINLTAADTVILHDLDFNPQADRQAEDRCHRIGQTRPVHVHRLVARDTVDENIFRIADRKRRLADDMLGEGAGDAGDADADSGKEDESMQRIIESCLARYLED